MKPSNTDATNFHVGTRYILDYHTGRKPFATPALVFISCVLWVFTVSSAYGQEYGTAAVAIWQPDQIVIGMDSKVTHLGGEPPGAICKVRSSGRFFFAISGFYGRTGSDFDVWDIAARVVETAQTVPNAAALLEESIAAGLPKALDSARLSNPQEFDRKLSKSYLAFFVAGIDAGKLVMAGRNFIPGAVLREEYPGTRPVGSGATGLTVFGDRDVIDRTYSTQQQVALAAANPIETARKFVQLEIDGESATVGPPTSIFVFTRNEYRWEEAGLCSQ